MQLCLVSEMKLRYCVLFRKWSRSLVFCFENLRSGQLRMLSTAENHPCAGFSSNQDAFLRWESSLPDISSNQDAFLRWKSSLPELFNKSGCISPMEIIPAQSFLQIRMHFSAGNHPCAEFSSNQDEFLRWKSSLPDIFFESGCISPLEIIPA